MAERRVEVMSPALTALRPSDTNSEPGASMLDHPLAKMLSILDASEQPLSPDALVELLKLSVSTDELAPWIKFEDEKYARNSIRRTRNYEALCLCWKRGQKSPPHDHWNSSAAIQVISGTAHETLFENHGDYIQVIGERAYESGDIRVEGSDLIHQFGNLSDSTENLVTLHIYSPPLPSVDQGKIYEGGRIRSVGSHALEDDKYKLPL